MEILASGGVSFLPPKLFIEFWCLGIFQAISFDLCSAVGCLLAFMHNVVDVSGCPISQLVLEF